jgi:kynurenine formamidase
MTAAWGRWGSEDQRGAANLVDAAALGRALGAVRERRSISLAAPLSPDSPVAPLRAPMSHYFTRDAGDYLTGARVEVEGMGFADDYLCLAAHGTTHLDALCHVWSDGTMYNGFDARHVTSAGATALGIEQVGPIVTRGILLDASSSAADAGEDGRITPDRLEAMLSASGVPPEPGDALLVRTGWVRRRQDSPGGLGAAIGLTRDCADWVADYDFALVGSDNPGIEVMEREPGGRPPLHVSLIRDRGIYLLELLDLDALAAVGPADCMLVVNPMPVRGGSGGPCAPVAIV